MDKAGFYAIEAEYKSKKRADKDFVHYLAKFYTDLILKNAVELSKTAFPVEQMAQELYGEQFEHNKKKGELINGNATSIPEHVYWVLSNMVEKSRISGFISDDINDLICKYQTNILEAHPEVLEDEDSNHHFIDDEDDEEDDN